jgi:hydrogenase maturation factor
MLVKNDVVVRGVFCLYLFVSLLLVNTDSSYVLRQFNICTI